MSNQEEINRLNFENNIWILFACLCLINIVGDNNLKDYLRTNNINKKIFLITYFFLHCLLLFLYIFIFLIEILRHIKKQVNPIKNFIKLKFLEVYS